MTSITPETKPFESFCPLSKADGGTADTDAPMVVSGPIASETSDFDGDTMLRAGIVKGLDMFNRLGGHVDYNHLFGQTQDPDHIIGQGEVFYVEGRPWLKTTLRKGNSLAEKTWRMVRDGVHCGYSLLGNGVRDGNKVVSTIIKMITIAPQPKGFDQFLQVGTPVGSLQSLAKALVDDTQLAGLAPEWTPLLALSSDRMRHLSTSPISYLPPLLAKSLTTGNDVVMPGDTGGAVMRPQFLHRRVESASGGRGNSAVSPNTERVRLIRRLMESDPSLSRTVAGRVADALIKKSDRKLGSRE